MSGIDSKLKEEKEIITKLFNFSGNKKQFKELKEIFYNFIKQSKNGSTYFIKLLDQYSFCRPNQLYFIKELVKCIYSCFPKENK